MKAPVSTSSMMVYDASARGRDRSAARVHLRVRWQILWFPRGPQSGSHHARFRKPPCDPEQRDFPDSVLTLAVLCKPFQPRRSLSAGTRTPRGRWFALQAGPYGGSSRLPVDQPCDRQAPRAPLPQSGVTFMGKTSCVFSKGITLPSSLIRTHAPSPYPPSDFRFRPYSKGLCRLLPAPAA